jgi:hypothetical protein
MYKVHAVINDSGHTVWQEIGQFDTIENAEAIAERHTATYGVQTVIEEN